MIMAKDVVEWLVCEPIGSNEKLVSKMEQDVLAYFAEAQKNGATDRDILVTWNYVSTCLAGILDVSFRSKQWTNFMIVILSIIIIAVVGIIKRNSYMPE